jgi:hypothetical protein
MTVRRALWRQLRGRETVLLLVRTAQPARLERAVHAALPAFAAADPAYVSTPVAVPDGWLVMVDFDSSPPAARRPALEDFAARIEAASGGVDAELGPAPTISNRYQAVFDFAPVARAPLAGRGPAGARLPTRELLDASLGWLRERAPVPGDPIMMVMSVEVPSPWDRLPDLVAATLPSAGMLTVISTDFATAQSSVTFGAFRGTGVALCFSGPGTTAVPAEMRSQRDAIRAHVDTLSWAGVVVEGNGQIIVSPATSPYDDPEPYPMWFQVLTAEQVRRLGGAPPGGVALPDGRAELTVGEPEQWLPDHPDHEDVRARARVLLTPRT